MLAIIIVLMLLFINWLIYFLFVCRCRLMKKIDNTIHPNICETNIRKKILANSAEIIHLVSIGLDFRGLTNWFSTRRIEKRKAERILFFFTRIRENLERRSTFTPQTSSWISIKFLLFQIHRKNKKKSESIALLLEQHRIFLNMV